MLTIMELEPQEGGRHRLQSQSHRDSCWLEGWIEVPKELQEKAWSSGGFCRPVLEDGRLKDLVSIERPSEPEEEATTEELLNILLGGEEDE